MFIIDLIARMTGHPDQIAETLVSFIRDQVRTWKKQGITLGVSGGVDSAVALHLAIRACGKERIRACLLPEKESAAESTTLARELCDSAGVGYTVCDITPTLEALGLFERKEAVTRKYFPEYDPDAHATALVFPAYDPSSPSLTVPYLKLVGKGRLIGKKRLSAEDYLEIVSLQNMKQRTRMIMLYNTAERFNYLVCGTTNKTEYLLGQYVKYGDGGVDIEPLADCYKTRVYSLAYALQVPEPIIERPASPDTWSHFTSDQDFYWRLPLDILDPLLYAQEHGIDPALVMESTGLSAEMLAAANAHISRMRRATTFISMAPPICSVD